jgi:hypothetical protein
MSKLIAALLGIAVGYRLAQREAHERVIVPERSRLPIHMYGCTSLAQCEHEALVAERAMRQ